MLRYPVSLTTEGGQVLVDFLDLPAHTYGYDEGEAFARAVDALTTMIGAYMRHRQPIPAPSAPKHGGPTVPLPPLLVAKVELYKRDADAAGQQGRARAAAPLAPAAGRPGARRAPCIASGSIGAGARRGGQAARVACR